MSSSELDRNLVCNEQYCEGPKIETSPVLVQPQGSGRKMLQTTPLTTHTESQAVTAPRNQQEAETPGRSPFGTLVRAPSLPTTLSFPTLLFYQLSPGVGTLSSPRVGARQD